MTRFARLNDPDPYVRARLQAALYVSRKHRKAKLASDIDRISSIKDIIFLHTASSGLLLDDDYAAENDSVSKILDIGPNEIHATQNTSDYRPVYEIKDGSPSLYLDGTDDGFSINFPNNGPSDCSIFIAVRPDSDNTNFILSSDANNGTFYGAAQIEAGASPSNDPSVSTHVNNYQSVKTRGDLYIDLEVDKWSLVEIRNVNLSNFSQVNFSRYPGWSLKGHVADIVIIPTSEITVENNSLIMNYYEKTFGLSLAKDIPLLTSEGLPVYDSEGNPIYVIEE